MLGTGEDREHFNLSDCQFKREMIMEKPPSPVFIQIPISSFLIKVIGKVLESNHERSNGRIFTIFESTHREEEKGVL